MNDRTVLYPRGYTLPHGEFCLVLVYTRLLGAADTIIHYHIPVAKYKWHVHGNVHSHSGLCVGHCSDTLRPLWTTPWPGELDLEGGSLAIA